MKALTCLLVGTLVLSGVNGDNVLDLGDSDFDSRLEEVDTALVMFYAPWCGHCKKLKPEFEKSAGDLLKNDPPVSLVKVDCTEAGKDICGRFEVRGYPTLKIFRGGELSSDYNGPRDANGITKYMMSQVGPASKTLKSISEVDAYLKTKKEAVIVSYGSDKEQKDAFLKVANALRETRAFANVEASDEKHSGIVLHRPTHLVTKLEDAEVVYKGDMSKDKITAWIKSNYHGLVGHREHGNMMDFENPLLVAYFDVDYVKNVKGTNYWRNRVMKVAKSHKDLNFAVSNKEDFISELNEFGMDTPSTPDQKAPLVTFRSAKNEKFIMTEAFSMDALSKFLSDYKDGSLEPYMKSEALPDNSKNAVKVVVGKNFEELIGSEKTKDILIEFYAPWCGHCKKLTPIYDELGEAMKDENVLIAKMDATANDVPPEFNVRGFPTLFWIPAGGKPVSYEGGREKIDFIQYIAKHATEELNGFNRKGKSKKSEL
uniref:Protein disulfide-isomerase n=1 Tax=Caligus rogercresseyi TaxID=217165 RepID=C1BNX3_CALRO|nr:disulfide-isomerase A3 precursor [Caligus rogercresseyi]|eukprot:TRINITY_DN121_c0_g1_i2.p1 TRINITY_DN121_c0_g1~~TRINITY_DN121_c0_g1_i2.p1  ORF type:complete len:485 (-),score=199.64 TRINITY_DN121_c0_g1_i2:298-1752(-)